MPKTNDAVKILDSMVGRDARVRRLVDEAVLNSEVAQLIYKARMRAGLTQHELANLVGTKQPVIARLEDADYEGHSLAMLNRIALALRQRVRVRFEPLQRRRKSA
jgi:predicted transcriptional regulator